MVKKEIDLELKFLMLFLKEKALVLLTEDQLDM